MWSSQGVWTLHTTAGEAADAWSGILVVNNQDMLLLGTLRYMKILKSEKKVVTGGLSQCGAAKECGPRTPPQEKQQPHGVEAILKNHERTERYTSMICALVKI